MKPNFTVMASAHFLTNELPLDYSNWSESQLETFLLNNVWEPFESMDESQYLELVWESIELLAQSLKSMYEQQPTLQKE